MRKTLHSKEYKALTSLLSEARTAAGLTQEQVPAKLKKPQSFVSKYESGERRLDVVEFIRIAVVLGAKPQELIGKLVDRL